MHILDCAFLYEIFCLTYQHATFQVNCDQYTKIIHIDITRERKMEFSNPTLQVKYEHDPGI